MYKKTIVPRIQPIEKPPLAQLPNMNTQGQQSKLNNVQNGDANPFMSKTRSKREDFTTTSPPISSGGGLSYKELNAKRDKILNDQMAKMRQESKMMMERYMDEAKRRDDLLQNEINMRSQEEVRKQQLLQKRMDEAEAIAKARKNELKKQESLLRHEHLNAEMDGRRRKEEAVRLEQQRANMLQGKESQEKKEEDKAKMQAQIRERELQRAEERKVEEMIRQKELIRLQNDIRKEQQIRARKQMEFNSRESSVRMDGPQLDKAQVDIQGFGSAKTGLVSRRKLALLEKVSTRAASLGPASDATDSNTTNNRCISTHASPVIKKRSITMPVNMTPRPNNAISNDVRKVGRIRDMDDPLTAQEFNEYNANCQVTTNTNSQWSMLAQQTAAIANADFASQTQALNSGLSRATK